MSLGNCLGLYLMVLRLRLIVNVFRLSVVLRLVFEMMFWMVIFGLLGIGILSLVNLLNSVLMVVFMLLMLFVLV